MARQYPNPNVHDIHETRKALRLLKQQLDDLTPSGGGAAVSDAAYSSAWNGVTDIAPSKNAVYDKIESLPAAIPGVEGEFYFPFLSVSVPVAIV